MYNMKFNFSIFGTNYSISLTFILLGIILWLILSGNLLCSCLHVMPYEGFEVMKGAAGAIKEKVTKKGKGKVVEKLTTKTKGKEGFVGANLNNGESSQYDMDSSQIDTSKWFGPNLQNKNSQFVKDFNNRPAGLPSGSEMLLFKDTKSSPECCQNNPSFSNSEGCLCISGPQYDFLISRGGNNSPYSEY
jgi:hypothetical protein